MSNTQSTSSGDAGDQSSPLAFYFLMGTVGLALLMGLWMLIQMALFT